MLEAEYITRQEFGIEMKSYMNELSSGPVFSKGHAFVELMKKTASIKEIIRSPEKYFEDIMSLYGSEIESLIKKS